MNTDRLRERYAHDNDFHMIVNAMYAMIHEAKFTPQEMRDALFFANYKYEIEHVRPFFAQSENVLPCTKCKRPSLSSALCPYQRDVNGIDQKCNCCESCRQDCADDI